MSGKMGPFSFLILSCSFLLGCADPKYVKPSSESLNNQNQKPAYTCEIRFRTSSLCLSWSWERKPTETEKGAFIFRVYSLDPVDRFPVLQDFSTLPKVILWMPSMGHGSSPVQVSRLGVGTYRASQVFFVMPGDWEIRFQVKDGDMVLDEASVSLIF